MENNENESKRKIRNKTKMVGVLLGTAATINTINDARQLITSSIVARTNDGTEENTVGYEEYNTRFNTTVHSNNFVVLKVSEKSFNDITNLRNTLNECKDRNISVCIVLDTKAENLAKMHKNIDFLQAVVKQYNIDMPIYCNIDNIMNNKKLNNAEKQTLIEAFLDKATRSNMYVGLYGSDASLTDCNEYITKITDYDTFLVEDGENIKYSGSHNITKDLNGVIGATIDLSEIVKERNLNNSTSLVYSQGYIVKEGETLHSIALTCGLSENDLKEYNHNIKEVNAGDTIYIPNLYMTYNKDTNTSTYNYAIARGIDISDFQTNIDWDRVAETSDYVIVEVARDDGNYLDNEGYYLSSSIKQIKGATSKNIDLGLYFCIYKEMNTKIYEQRLDKYLTKLDKELEEQEVTIDKVNVPVFIDFEVYTKDNDYYELLQVFKDVCSKHGYSKVGIYGNGSTLNSICINMISKHNTTLKNTDFYVWKAGGPQYSSDEHNDEGISLDNLKEYRGESTSNFTVDMQQVTNVCNDVGASNSSGHCDVSYLYDEEMFGHKYSREETTEVMEVDLNNYRNIPVHTITSSALNTVSALTALGYAALGLKTLAKKLKQKHKENTIKKTLE